jgi:hypothetical protein
MIVKKLDRGLYDVFDDQYNHYQIEDARRPFINNIPPDYATGNEWRWGIWEQEDGEWLYLDGNLSMAECLTVISLWADANEYLR